MKWRRKKTYEELEFHCELTPPEAMGDDLKMDLCAMWGEILLDVLEEK
jgi:hypothetical protein